MSVNSVCHSGRSVLVLCVLAAGAYAAVGILQGSYVLAIVCPAIMFAYGGLLLVFRRRNETVSILGGTAGDERQRLIMTRASAASGQVVTLGVLVAMFVALAMGAAAAAVLVSLAALGGFSFMAFTWWYSRHS